MHSPGTRDFSTVASEQLLGTGGSAAATAPSIISIGTSPGEAAPVPCGAMLSKSAGGLQSPFYRYMGV